MCLFHVINIVTLAWIIKIDLFIWGQMEYEIRRVRFNTYWNQITCSSSLHIKLSSTCMSLGYESESHTRYEEREYTI